MRTRQWHWTIAGLVLVTTVLPGRAPAATLEVKAGGGTPFQTIQSAINAAVAGVDSVYVHCGTYPENIVMRDRVSVTGAGPDCAVVDGGAMGPVVRMVGLSSTTTLSGFRITNGRGALAGGVYIEGGMPTVTSNVIVGNSAIISGVATGYGGGIHITDAPPGAALAQLAAVAPLVTRNVISGNSAAQWGGGIAVYNDSGSVITNNLVIANSAAQGGGGIDVFQSFPTISNNTILQNCLQGMGAACQQGGGGVALTLSGVLDIANNVIAWNEAAIGGGGVDQSSSSVTYTRNDAFLNLPSNYAGVVDPTGSNGNMSTDPLFEGAAIGLYHPRSDSPLLETASDALAPADDMRGRPRPLDADADGVSHADIGALENDGLTGLRFGAGSSDLLWDPSANPAASYNLYRGDVQTLLQTGIYTQDPGTVSGAERQCGLTSPAATDLDSPASQRAFFYLVVVTDVVEGTLGFTSGGSERPFAAGNSCP